jgi:hypothetical protein
LVILDKVIYGIRLTNDPTYEYRYVGLTSRGVERFKEHLEDARSIKSPKYEAERSKWIRRHYFAVTFDILSTCDTLDDLDFNERMWITILRERGHRLFNLSSGGQRGEMSSEVKARISESLTGKVKSEESKLKQSVWWIEHGPRGEAHPNFGRVVSEDTRRKQADAKAGTTASEATKLKMSITRLKNGFELHSTSHDKRKRHCRWCLGADLQEEIKKRELELNDNKME